MRGSVIYGYSVSGVLHGLGVAVRRVGVERAVPLTLRREGVICGY